MGTLLVYLIKPSGKDIRICGNCKININKYLKDFNYPLPRVEDIFCAVQCGKKFTKLDFSNAYNQLLVNEKTKSYYVGVLIKEYMKLMDYRLAQDRLIQFFS